nr:major facilitator superfamily domain-containing protein 6-like [Lytechinus pictus]
MPPGKAIDPSLLGSHPPQTERVQLVNEGEQRSRLLTAYTYTVEQLLEEQELQDERREKRGSREKNDDENVNKYSSNDNEDGHDGGCRRYLTKCIQKCNETLAPYKLLYIFIRGGEACLTMYVSVYALQVGVNPLQLAFIYALPRFISSLSTPLCGYIADKFRCRKEMLLFALCLWVLFSLAVNFVPAPQLTGCNLARNQFQDTIARLNISETTHQFPVMMSVSISSSTADKVQSQLATGLVRNYGDRNAACMIHDNVTAITGKPSWLSILHIVSTPWTEKTEKCYPGGRFWGANHVPGGVDVDGPSSTYAGWIYERDSLTSSFFAIFALITVAHVMQGPTLSLTDTSTLHTLGPTKSHEYGWQVAFGNASFAIYMIVITIIIDMASASWWRCGVEIHVEDYRIALAIFFGTTSCAIALLFAYCINMKFENPNESNITDLKKIFCRLNNVILLPTMCFLAANEGAISVFLPFHLINLGAPSFLVKSSRIVTGISELFLAFHLGQLIKTRGHIVLLSCGAIGYLLCFLGYALITSPFGIMPVQIVHGMSHALTWNVIVARFSGDVNPENLATLQGCLWGLYLSGLGIGAVVAGIGVSYIGSPVTFFCFAFACLFIGILLGVGAMSTNERPTRTRNVRYKSLPASSDSDEDG